MRLFDADDYSVIQGWFQRRGSKAPPYTSLPRVGFIEDHYAAGFLIQTDTPVAIIDFLVSNPSTDITKRAEAVSAVVRALIEEAKRRGFKYLKCTSKIRSVGRLARSYRFSVVGDFTTYYREIGNG